MKVKIQKATTNAHAQCRGVSPTWYKMATRNVHIASTLRKSVLKLRWLSSGHALSEKTVRVLDKEYLCDHMTNVTPTILSRVGRNLHRIPHHPVSIIKERVVQHFYKTYTTRVGNPLYVHIQDTPPIVTTEQNFDSLLIPKEHISRSKNDNYYINSDYVLRAHTSAHQRDFVKMGFDQFLVTGDVYRRDEIDSSHYPVFHQMEGVRVFTKQDLFHTAQDDTLEVLEQHPEDRIETDEKQAEHTIDAAKMLELNLKGTLEGVVKDLFGHDTETRWLPCYFPFTHPSYELEIKFQGEWLEVLGSGIMRQGILDKAGASNKVGWAFGLGLDRLAMLMFDIPDIRLLWSEDPRFLKQFKNVTLDRKTDIKFKSFSKFPPCFKDVSFWIRDDFNANDFYEVVRSIGGDLIEKVELIDSFSSSHKVSHCYRITYRSMDRSVTNEEINNLQERLRRDIENNLNVELR